MADFPSPPEGSWDSLEVKAWLDELLRTINTSGASRTITVYSDTGPHTHTFASGTTKAKVYVTGGGGGSSGASTAAYSGCAGGTAIAEISVTASTADITVGAGSDSAVGGTSSYDDGTNTISATGGAVGALGAAGGVGSGGDINLRGGGSAYDGGFAALGGASYWGGGNSSDNSSVTPAWGAGSGSRREFARSPGGDGVVIIEEY